ncbi:putative cell division protein FtsW [Bifidobacterium gallicum DSM 20093 = LMG 11596]|nr:putative cell division protein FtsW [Bifidobacterium gallicum DSM 20093 = LMG 11596]
MSVIVLTVFGVIMVFSSSTVAMVAQGSSPWSKALNQSIFAIIGVVLALIAMHVPERFYKKWANIVLIGAIVLQLATIPFGTEVNGNSGWIYIFGLSVQPAEFTKYALCIWLPGAMVIGRKQYERTPAGRSLGEQFTRVCGSFRWAIIGYAVALGAVLLGKDLGTAIIVLFIGGIGFLIGGFPGKALCVLAALAVVLVVGFVVSSPNRMSRILATYRECSTDDITGVCYQAMHAEYALGSGGILGVGLGNSREKWNYLPEAHNDFIYAIIGEETGLVGTTIVLLLFVIMGWCLYTIARATKDRYTSIALMCFGMWIIGQALVNIGVVIRIFPVMGVPLPFVSAGGSSLVMCLLAAGTIDAFMRAQPQIHAELSRV